jgi:hypothetical protein
VSEDLPSGTEHGKRWRTMDVILTVIFFGLVLLGGEIRTTDWWRSLGTFARAMIVGSFLEIFGISFLWIKWKQERLAPENIWELKWLLFEVAMILGGIVCFFQAFD